VNPNQVNLYGRPTNATNDALWEKALRENPDPTCHVPVLAVGFDDLRTRVEAQNKKSEQHRQLLKDIKSRIESLATQHINSNSPRFLRAIAAQTQSSQKLSKIVQNIYLLLPSVRSSPISPEEERLGAALEEIEDEFKKGTIKGKINELWAYLSTIQGCAGTETGEWAVVDEDGFAQLTQVRAFSHILSLVLTGLYIIFQFFSPHLCSRPNNTIRFDNDLTSLSIIDPI